MNIVFHGKNAETFRAGIENDLIGDAEISVLSDGLSEPGEAEAYAQADVIIGTRRTATHPAIRAKVYQVAGAGYDGIDLSTLPEDTTLCNVFGHEDAIAEYVMAVLLARHVPFMAADRQLRAGNWFYQAGRGEEGLRGELGAQSIGIVGYGHIGQTVAKCALAFGMDVHVANRSPVTTAGITAHELSDLGGMMGQVDYVLNTLPLADGTKGLIGAEALAAMHADAIIMNVGRGAVIDEDALYDALSNKRIGGAVIDTWYVYPAADNPAPQPSRHPFNTLDNVIMTPHMSGWTHGTIDRRRKVIAENINRLAAGKELVNRVL